MSNSLLPLCTEREEHADTGYNGISQRSGNDI